VVELDSVLVANETIDYLKKEKKKGVIVKVDYEKAYDSVDWEFLIYMMGRLGFNTKWIHWIKVCFKSATISVLVNGSPTKQFKPKRGLRQGDPLAPFLFLIVAEGLASLVRATVSKGHYEGVKVGLNSVGINLLQFMDDTLFFCQPTYKCIMVVKTILQCFELVSGLKVNFHKSSVGTIEVDDMDLSIFSSCLNCSIMHLPFKYLGLIIGGNYRVVSFWKPIVDKIKTRLSRCKGRLMLLAKRVCLIKFVLSELALFYLSFLRHLLLFVNLSKRYKFDFYGVGGMTIGNCLDCMG